MTGALGRGLRSAVWELGRERGIVVWGLGFVPVIVAAALERGRETVDGALGRGRGTADGVPGREPSAVAVEPGCGRGTVALSLDCEPVAAGFASEFERATVARNWIADVPDGWASTWPRVANAGEWRVPPYHCFGRRASDSSEALFLSLPLNDPSEAPTWHWADYEDAPGLRRARRPSSNREGGRSVEFAVW